MASLRDLSSRMIIGNLDIPLIVIMRPNPYSWDVNKEKVFSETQTLGGWVNEHWGNKQDTISCAGRTQSKVGRITGKEPWDTTSTNGTLDKISKVQGSNDAQFAEVDRAMLKLEQVYQLDKQRIVSFYKAFSGGGGIATGLSGNFNQKITGNRIDSLQNLSQSFIIYKFTIYFGFFANFHYKEDAENPRIYNYDYKFKVTWRSTDFVTQSLLNNFPEARAASLFTQRADIGKVAEFLATNAGKFLKSALF